MDSRIWKVLLVVVSLLSLGWAPPKNEATVLFDGKSLTNWSVIGCEVEVKDGAILLKAGNGLVQSKRQYGDCVFDFEWKAVRDASWDSGIYFRYQTVPKGKPWPNKYQVNLRQGMEGNLGGFREAINKLPVKAHEWNRFTITMVGSTVELQVNGKRAWKVDGVREPKGFIALQAEVPGGGQFLFRNIRVTERSKDGS